MTIWPESPWHAHTKTLLARHLTATTESPLIGADGTERRADVLVPGGLVVELQHGYLGVTEIAERERFYDRVIWLYDGVLLAPNLHRGRRGGYWLKNHPVCLAAHRRPVYVDFRDDGILWLFDLTIVEGRRTGSKRVISSGRWFGWDEWIARVAAMGGQRGVA